MITLKEGIFAVKLARKAVSTYIKSKKQIDLPKEYPKEFEEKGGVFVTLKTYEKTREMVKKDLRGCIGFPYPTYPLIQAIIESSIASATRDSRFHPPFGPGPVTEAELPKIVFEVSILTPPELLKVEKPAEYLEKIKIGRDGLIVERDKARGLLLPQVPVEWKWTVEKFLERTCNKAFLPTDSWKILATKIYTFQARIFEEVKPFGDIRQKEIGED